MIYLSAIFLGVILSTGSIFPMISNVQAQPNEHVKIVERFDQADVPAGMTRVTIIHGVNEQRTEIDHGPGKISGPLQKNDSFVCDTGSGTDQCDSNSWTGHKWTSLPLQYYVNIPSIDDGHFLDAVNAGINVWEADPNSGFDATYMGPTTKTPSTSDKHSRMDGYNVIGWGDTTKYGAGVIAVVVYYYYTSDGRMAEADMRFNDAFDWSSNGGPDAISNPDSTNGVSCCYDVQAIASHEGGHFTAGLKDLYDSSESKLTMYGYGAHGQLYARTLGYGDQLSIHDAYPPSTTQNITLVSIAVTPANASIEEGTYQQYVATGTYSDNSEQIITDQVTWSSSDETVATISNSGNAYGASPGFTTIKATSGSVDGTTSLTVTTTASPPTPGSQSVVDSINYSTDGGRYQDKHLNILVHVADDLGNDVSGATVSIDLFLDGGPAGSGSGTTDSQGNVAFRLSNAPSGCYTTTITDVSASGLTWDNNTPANEKCK